MAIECSFAGVPFRLPTPDVIAFCEKYGLLDFYDVDPTCDSGRIGPSLGVPVPRPYKPKLGEFWFPCGMSRCAIFQGIATGVDVAAMKAACLPTTGTFAGGNFFQPFIMQNDGLGGNQSINYQMQMLPPRPLTIVDGDAAGGLWLVTLVDYRYLLRFNSADFGFVVTCTGGPGSGTTGHWQDLLEWYTANIYIDIGQLPTVPAVYGYPEPDSPLYGIGERFCTVLDAIAANIGGFVTPSLPANIANGTGGFLFQTWNAAVAATKAARLSAAQRVAGGPFFNPDTSVVDTTRYLNLPNWVDVYFPKYITGTGYFDPTPYRDFYRRGNSYPDVFCVEVKVTTLGSPYAENVIQINEEFNRFIQTTAKALYATYGSATDTAGANPTNYTAVLALANQLAKDYLDQEMLALDEIYQGIQPWPSNTGHDVLYVWNSETCFTRVRRRPFDSAQREFQHGFGPVASAIPQGVRAGSITIAPPATTASVTFSGPMPANTEVVVSPQESSNPFYVTVSTTGFTLTLTAANSTSVTYSWVAVTDT